MDEVPPVLGHATFTPSAEAWMDMVVGRFIRWISGLETMLLLTRNAAGGSVESLVDLDLRGPDAAIDDLKDALARFPEEDQDLLGAVLDTSREVLVMRQVLVHGRWTLLDDGSQLYRSERIVPSKKEARRLTGKSQLTDDDYPLWRHEFNRDAVLKRAEEARGVALYLANKLDRWYDHFGVPEDLR